MFDIGWFAKLHGEFAKAHGEFANVHGKFANVYGKFANVYGEFANAYGEFANAYGAFALRTHLLIYTKHSKNKIPTSFFPKKRCHCEDFTTLWAW